MFDRDLARREPVALPVESDVTSLLARSAEWSLVGVNWVISTLQAALLAGSLDQERFTVDKEDGNILFSDTLNTFCLRSYGVGHMVKDHSDNERGIPLLPHMLLSPISSKHSFICIIPQTG